MTAPNLPLNVLSFVSSCAVKISLVYGKTAFIYEEVNNVFSFFR